MGTRTLTGMDLATQLADVLGTGGIVGIKIEAHVKDMAKVTIERYAKFDEQDGIRTVFEQYRLTPIEDEEPA